MRAFKFRSASQIAFAFDIIVYQRLYCSPWNIQNDPMEGIFAYSYGTDKKSNIVRRIEGITDAKRKYRICSLSSTYDCHLLWAHYAGGFDGVAIEVDLPDNDPNIKPVEYRGVFAFLNMNRPMPEDEAARKILFSKYKEWEYEKEIRVLGEHEYYTLETPVRRVIAGHRMPRGLFDVLNITCTSLGIEFSRVGIGDEGIDAGYVPRPRQLIPK